jgi:hypothetical protein
MPLKMEFCLQGPVEDKKKIIEAITQVFKY